MSTLRLFCYRFDGSDKDYFPFAIEVGLNCDGDQIKDAVQTKCKLNISNDSIKIWKVDPPVKGDGQEIQSLKTYLDGRQGQHISPTKLISNLFPVQPERGHIHLVAFTPLLPEPPLMQTRIKSAPLSPTTTRREDLANLLYDKLTFYKFVQVRGTPASGKTVLMELLHRLIEIRDPEANIHVIRGPRPENGYDLETQLKEITGYYPSQNPHNTYLLFDDAQDSYPDSNLWSGFFKNGRTSSYRVALFGRAGNPRNSTDLENYVGMSDTVENKRKLLLWPTDETPLGLLLSSAEYQDMVLRASQGDAFPTHLDSQLSDKIFHWTAGHAGTIQFFFDQVRIENKASQRAGIPCTLDTFLNQPKNTIRNLAHRFINDSAGRGFPRVAEIQVNTKLSSMFRVLLKDGYIKKETNDKNMQDVLQYSHRKGWTYSASLTKDGIPFDAYVMPSPIHTCFLSWYLLSSEQVPLEGFLLDFVISAVFNFKPAQLFIPVRRAHQTAITRVPEAQFQDEFYRSSHSLTEGNIYFSPDFASAVEAKFVGGIDFFLASNGWGIELTKEGDRLNEHSQRFADTEAYGNWLKSEEMEDYVLLDCRTTTPREKHPNIPKLLHAVFTEDYSYVEFYNNQLQIIDKGVLSQNRL